MPRVSAAQEYYNLGSFSRRVTTNSPDAQIWFDRGLTWVYSFNHEAAVYCFEQAITHDKTCAMAYWGLAYAVGPNYNKPWDHFDQSDLSRSVKWGYVASRTAKKKAIIGTVEAWENAIIDAMLCRFNQRKPLISPEVRLLTLSRRYAVAMQRVYKTLGRDNIKIAVLFADALINITPWDLILDRGHIHYMPTHLDILAVYNYHSLIYTAMFTSQLQTALNTVTHMENSIPKDVLCILYCVTTAIAHYAKGLAFATMGNINMAIKEQDFFYKTRALVLPKFGTAWKYLCRLPWAWMQPRHVEQAATEYRADLGFNDTLIRPRRHPKNVWALQGYHECLRRVGRDAEAREIEPDLRHALDAAEVPIRASCFCRLVMSAE
ncbi:uncharacterized protein BDV14DRAFT_193950 [Aspergillus stella-maris]|uniref:uncharacterized protein n=1 Tax=Aspergillus stella-maris TaxID=1810926 RepID=UPI003CCE2E12